MRRLNQPELLVATLTVASLVAFTLFRDHVIGWVARVPRPLTVDFFQRSATSYFAANLLVRGAPLAVLLLGCLYPAVRHSLLSGLRCARLYSALRIALVTAAVSAALNVLIIWPFNWRLPGESSLPIMAACLASNRVGAVLVWGGR